MEIEEETFIKSPKTPKLNEEITEMTLKSPLLTTEEKSIIIDNHENDNNNNNDINDIKNEQSKDDLLELNLELDLDLKEILKEIINSAPAGQSQQISLLCNKLFENNKSDNLKEFIDQETRHKLIKDALPLGKFLVTEDNYDQKTEEVKFGNSLMKFSALETKEIVEESESECKISEFESKTSEFEIQLKKKLENYVKELFPGTGSFLLHKTNEKSWKIHILGQRIKSKTFWSGHWHSIWQIESKEEHENENLQETTINAIVEDNFNFNFTINGKIELIVHYHEDGSVQLSSEKEMKSLLEMKANSINQAIDKIYWKIRDSENSFQLALNEAYQQLSETIFKKLRRQLPVTRTKMDWSKFVNYNLSNELKK